MQSDGETRGRHCLEVKPTVCVQIVESGKQSQRERESLVFYPSPGRREETFQRMLQGLVMDLMWKLWFLARKPG